MLQKQGKIRTGEIVSKETMAQVMADAGRSTLDAGRQRHANQMAIAQQMQKINAPLTALLKKDAAALLAARDLRAMVTLLENQRPVFTNAPVQFPIPIHIIEGTNTTFFTPSSYADPSLEGQGGYAKVADGEFGFNLSSGGLGSLEAVAGLGLASYQARPGDYQLRFSPLVEYSYNWNDISVSSEIAASFASIRILIHSNDANGVVRTEYDQTIPLWQDLLVASPINDHAGDDGGYLNAPGGGIGVQVYLNITDVRTYYFAIVCYGSVQAEGGSIAMAQLDIRVPFVVIEDFYDILVG